MAGKKKHLLKVIILGESGVGKTSIMNQVCFLKYVNVMTVMFEMKVIDQICLVCESKV